MPLRFRIPRSAPCGCAFHTRPFPCTHHTGDLRANSAMMLSCDSLCMGGVCGGVRKGDLCVCVHLFLLCSRLSVKSLHPGVKTRPKLGERWNMVTIAVLIPSLMYVPLYMVPSMRAIVSASSGCNGRLYSWDCSWRGCVSGSSDSRQADISVHTLQLRGRHGCTRGIECWLWVSQVCVYVRGGFRSNHLILSHRQYHIFEPQLNAVDESLRSIMCLNLCECLNLCFCICLCLSACVCVTCIEEWNWCRSKIVASVCNSFGAKWNTSYTHAGEELDTFIK